MKVKSLAAAAALLAGSLIAPAGAFASPGNGELCSIQNYDGSIKASVLTYGPNTAGQANRAQLGEAGAWCTGQIASGDGWYPADKTFDYYYDQVHICNVHIPGSSVVLEIFAYPSMAYPASNNCQAVAGYTPSNIGWYP